MTFFLIKTFISALIIALASEIAKRSTFWGALLVSLPTMSILTMIWLYIETKDVDKISSLSWNILWLVLPTLPFFVIVPILHKKGLSFPLVLSIACLSTAILYLGVVKVFRL
jgi:hypothetical protein